MENIAIVGVGNMGQAIAWAMEALGYKLLLLDNNQQSLDSCKKLLNNSSQHEFSVFSADETGGYRNEHNYRKMYTPNFDILQSCNAVISSMPFSANMLLSTVCADNNISYFDLGGSVYYSDIINRYTARKNSTCFTDLGLSPGWTNIIAENLYNSYINKTGNTPDSISMMVGGLPEDPKNTLKYTCTWSCDRLVKEYCDDCEILSNGIIKNVTGMGGYEIPTLDDYDIGDLEAFYTNGGGSHSIHTMQSRGVKNCSYKTIRYQGHHNIAKFLIRESGLNQKELANIFKNSCPTQKDLVIIKIHVDDLSFEQIIKSNMQFSAMQKCTAFPTASVVHNLLSSDKQGILKYEDVEYQAFNTDLEDLLSLAT